MRDRGSDVAARLRRDLEAVSEPLLKQAVDDHTWPHFLSAAVVTLWAGGVIWILPGRCGEVRIGGEGWASQRADGHKTGGEPRLKARLFLGLQV